jgi:hypothetical protein
MVSSGADRRAESGRVVRVTVVCATASARRASGETTRDRTPRTSVVEKGCRWIEKSRTLDPLCAESRVEPTRAGKSGNAGLVRIWIFSCEVDIFARFGPDRPRIAIGNADQTLAVNVPPPRPNRFARARCRHNAPRPDAWRGARESAGARVAEAGEAPSLPGVESRTDSRGAREAHRRTAPDARIPDGKRHRRTFHRGIDGDRARRSTDKRFDRETQTHARVRGASRDKAPGTGPCSVASARSPRPIRASNARLASFFPNARDTLARRGTFLSRREAHGVGARFDRSRPARPRTTPPLLEDRHRASPRPPPRGGRACRPRASRAPRVPAFSLTARVPRSNETDRFGRPPIDLLAAPMNPPVKKNADTDANRC